jgi:ABC-2 type transport system permease protein
MIFIWALSQLRIEWNIMKAGLLLLAYISGVALFNGIFIMQATTCFWTVESVEIGNVLTYGGVEAGRMPISIYPPFLRQFFTFVVPLACVSYYPWLYILNKPDPIGLPGWFALISPLCCLIFFLFSIGFWEIGLRSYTSAGG